MIRQLGHNYFQADKTKRPSYRRLNFLPKVQTFFGPLAARFKKSAFQRGRVAVIVRLDRRYDFKIITIETKSTKNTRHRTRPGRHEETRQRIVYSPPHPDTRRTSIVPLLMDF